MSIPFPFLDLYRLPIFLGWGGGTFRIKIMPTRSFIAPILITYGRGAVSIYSKGQNVHAFLHPHSNIAIFIGLRVRKACEKSIYRMALV